MSNIPLFYPQNGKLVRWKRSTASNGLAVNAGADQSVAAGAKVTMSATVTGGSGTYTYSWAQTSGTTVALTGANSATCTYTAPSNSTASTQAFQLTVNDGTATATDSVVISVAATSGWPYSQRFPGDPRTALSRKTYWGAAVGGSVQTVTQHEAAGGTTMGCHRDYLTASGTPSGIKPPNGQFFNLVSDDHANNRLPVISFKYDYSNWQAASTGAYDADWDNLISYCETNYKKPVWIIINHEPENDWKEAGYSSYNSSWANTYSAYWRGMQSRFRARLNAYISAHGPLKVIGFGPCLMSYSFGSAPWASSTPTMWWVDGIFDFFGIDVYGHSTTSVIPDNLEWKNTYNFTVSKNIPYVLCEWGYWQTDPNEAQKMTDFYNLNTDGSHDCLAMAWFDDNTGGTNFLLTNNNNGNALDNFNSLLKGPHSIHVSDLGY